MSDEGMTLGSNSREEFRRRIELMHELEDKKKEAADELTAVRKAAKSDGYNVKVMNQIVKERRAGRDKQAEQIIAEAELTIGRATCDQLSTLEEAQKHIASKAADVPDPDNVKRKRKKMN